MLEEKAETAHLRHMLASGEEILRAYDLKAEIAMICFVLSVEAINVFADLGRLKSSRPLLAVVLFLLFILALIGYMAVLLPVYKRKTGAASDYSPINVFFVTDPQALAPEQYLRTLRAVDHEREMVAQIIRLAEIRDGKHVRFLRALYATFAFYGLMLLAGIHWIASAGQSS